MVQESSSKRAGEELESNNSKKQKLDENVEAEVDDEAEMKKHMEIILDDEIGYIQTIRADGSLRRYSSMIRMLQNINKEDLETLWKLVKAKHGNTRPEEAYERVLWGDLKVMFEPDVESDVWRNLQGLKVTVWKLFSSSGVHFVRFQNMHIFMLVEKKYPLTPATITAMLNKKLQADHWNEMCYQLLMLMTKLVKNPGTAKVRVTAAKNRVTTAQTTTTAKLPILNQGEYDMWRLRIEQYFQVQDYALWDVIENENSFKPVPQTTTNVDGSSTLLIPVSDAGIKVNAAAYNC
ncbi:hypothetical protein Tco_0600694 [Tanacetum coccineum]